MTTPPPPPTGSITWIDLSVDDAEGVREFYQQVVGWTPEPIEMEGYDDYCMNTPDGTLVAGVCHARGPNKGLPAQWLVYITVEDIDASAALCEAHGGRVLAPSRNMGPAGRFCVIQDPAGAVAALYAPHPEEDEST